MERSQIIRPIIIVICIYLIVTTVQGTVELLGSGGKVTSREKELSLLEKQKQELNSRKNQAGTQDYLEKIAYGKLGLSRPGEEVMIIPQDLLTDHTPVVVKDDTPNWKKWLKLFI